MLLWKVSIRYHLQARRASVVVQLLEEHQLHPEPVQRLLLLVDLLHQAHLLLLLLRQLLLEVLHLPHQALRQAKKVVVLLDIGWLRRLWSSKC